MNKKKSDRNHIRKFDGRAGRQEMAERKKLAEAYPPRDDVDREIDRSVKTATPVDLSRAFPEIDPIDGTPPQAQKMAKLRAYPGAGKTMRAAPATRDEKPKFTIADEDQADDEGGEIPELPNVSDNPGDRSMNISKHSATYLEEYRLKVIARMLFRDLPIDMIASSMRMSIPAVLDYRRKLKKRLRHEAQYFDTTSYIGESLAFYREIEALTLRLGVDKNTATNHKLEAFRTALLARQHKSQMLHAFGVVDRIPFDPANKGQEFDGGNENANKLIDMVRAVMEGEEAIDAVYEVVDGDENLNDEDMNLT